MKSKKTKLIETAYYGGYQGMGNGGNEEILVKGYKFPVRRFIISGDLMHSIVIIVIIMYYILESC